MRVGDYIRCLRAINDISSKDMADKLGVHVVYYRELERGDRKLTPAMLVRIANVFGKTYRELKEDIRSGKRPDKIKPGGVKCSPEQPIVQESRRRLAKGTGGADFEGSAEIP